MHQKPIPLKNSLPSSQQTKPDEPIRLVEGGWSLVGVQSLAASLDAVRKWEGEFLGEELLEVWALDVVGLLELDNLKDLFERVVSGVSEFWTFQQHT